MKNCIKKVVTDNSKRFWIIFDDCNSLVYEKFEEIPEKYKEGIKDPSRIVETFCGPDRAYVLGVENELYPNFHSVCTIPGVEEELRCAAEACPVAPYGGYKKCKFIKNNSEGSGS